MTVHHVGARPNCQLAFKTRYLAGAAEGDLGGARSRAVGCTSRWRWAALGRLCLLRLFIPRSAQNSGDFHARPVSADGLRGTV